jgi:hypothetical protein
MVVVFMAMAPFERLHCVGCCEADALSCPHRGGKGLGAWVPLLPLKGFDKALISQVFVPLPSELFVLLVKLSVEGVMVVLNEA